MTGKKNSSEIIEDSTESLSLDEISDSLVSTSRRERQKAAALLPDLVKSDVEGLMDIKSSIIDALGSPEPLTRWECFDALSFMVVLDSSIGEDAYDAAEDSLFDEHNGTVRLAAFRFLCKTGAISEDFAEKVWPVLDEALQCFHGDPEYIDMLVAVNEFANCKLPEGVAKGLINRMDFDANNPKSGLVRRSNSIIEAANASLA